MYVLGLDLIICQLQSYSTDQMCVLSLLESSAFFQTLGFVAGVRLALQDSMSA